MSVDDCAERELFFDFGGLPDHAAGQAAQAVTATYLAAVTYEDPHLAGGALMRSAEIAGDRQDHQRERGAGEQPAARPEAD